MCEPSNQSVATARSSTADSEADATAPAPSRQAPADEQPAGLVARIDRWMAANPWHPRVAPLMLYIALLGPVVMLRDFQPWAFLPAYTLQCALVAYVLWRYRRLMPELTLSFHWSALPTGLGIFVIWITLGDGLARLFPAMFASDGYDYFAEMGQPALAWASMAVRLAGMAVLVPVFEELFNRSLTLRSFHRPRQTAIGVVNLVQELPLIDELLRDRDIARRAGQHDRVFAGEFERTPLGRLSVFGVAASTAVFMLVHGLRDWPAVIVCGIAYCLLVGYTNNSRRRLGLGPVIWAHGITNGALWAYTVYMHLNQGGDWRFFV